VPDEIGGKTENQKKNAPALTARKSFRFYSPASLFGELVNNLK